MVIVQLAKEMQVFSQSDGSGKGFSLAALPQALQNRVVSIDVYVHEVDADTRIRFPWAHGTAYSLRQGPGDADVWAGETSFLFDSGDSTGISTGMSASSSTTDISRVDVLAPGIECLKITAGSGQKKAVVSAWAVMKSV